MTTLIEGIILGIIQGITEWLPVSSSGHLVIAKHFLGIEKSVIFDIILHMGSLFVLLFVFRKKIISLITGLLNLEKESLKYIAMLIIATIPIALVGFYFNNAIKGIFDNILFCGIALIFTSFILFTTKINSNDSKRQNGKLNFLNTTIIGIMQSLAIIPGISRSAMTISTGLNQKINRKDTAEFAFLLFIPAIIGAILLEFPNIATIKNPPILLISFATTIVTGYFSLKYLLKVVNTKNFGCFGWYTLNIGVLLIVIELFF